MTQVEKYKVFQLQLEGTAEGNPYRDTSLRADFSSAVTGERVTVAGFYRGEGHYAIRFMPQAEGEWSYITHSSDALLDGITGSFACSPAAEGNHGRVLRRIDVQRGVDIPVAMSDPENVYKFSYEDGTPYLPFGTTCWGWIQQSTALQDQTLATLAASPFNMVRMFVLPMVAYFITDDPDHYPYQGSKADGFDYSRFNEAFFANLDQRIEQLDDLGIQAQLVLFHECDKPEWGFSTMSSAEDDFYVSYVARRYSAFKNIWWEPAKEWDILPQKSKEDWRRFGRVIMNNDPYGHLRSIQNCLTLWDYDESWLTHCSIQRIEVTKTAEYVSDWRAQWNKPVILDEAGYEGDFFWGWGSLTGQELVRRCWEGCIRGGYVTHGEAFIEEDNSAEWTGKGGVLRGESPARIGFLKQILEEAPANLGPIERTPDNHMLYWDVSVALSGQDYLLIYLGFNRPLYRELELPAGASYTIDVIDTWGMTIDRLPGTHTGTVKVDLGAKQYLAIRLIKAR